MPDNAPPHVREKYLHNLRVPTSENVQQIESVQRKKEEEVARKYKQERVDAAKIIQRNYRGHRVRRELQGLNLDPSTRWVEVR